MGTAFAAGAHSPATAGTPGSARSDPLNSPRGHSGQQTYDQSPATQSPPAPGNPAERIYQQLEVHFKSNRTIWANIYFSQPCKCASVYV